MEVVMSNCFFHTILLMIAGIVVNGDDVLKNAPWSYSAAPGVAGSAWKNADGSYSLVKRENSGIATLVRGGNKPVPMTPGERYRIKFQVTGGKGMSAGAMVRLMKKDGTLRSPWPAGRMIPLDGTAATAELEITVAPDEYAAQFVLKAQGTGELKVEAAELEKCTVGDYDPLPILKNAVWRMNCAEGAKGNLTENADGTLSVKKIGEEGFALLSRSGQAIPVTPGKSYLVRADVTGGQGISLAIMAQIKKADKTLRSPWPLSNYVPLNGNSQTLELEFTAQPGEFEAQFPFVVRGQGEFRILNLEFLLAPGKKNLTKRFFNAGELRKYFTVNGAQKLLSPQKIDFLVNDGKPGIFCDNLDWKAADIAAVEVEVAAWNTPGYILLEFASESEDGKIRRSYMTNSMIISGAPRALRFEVKRDPAWCGHIRELGISMSLRFPAGGRLAFSRLAAIPENNLIPFAAEVTPKQKIALDYVLPRGHYRLRWNDGAAPECSIVMRDRMNRLLKTVKLPAGSEEVQFTAPEKTVTT